MAKKSKIAKNEQRRAIVERYAERRAELKEIIRPRQQPRAARCRTVRAEPPAARCQCGAAAQSRRGGRPTTRLPAQVRFVPCTCS